MLLCIPILYVSRPLPLRTRSCLIRMRAGWEEITGKCRNGQKFLPRNTMVHVFLHLGVVF